jgi:hypothetical protein
MGWFKGADTEFVKAIQKGVGARVDGYFGEQTLFETALMFHELGIVELELPLATQMYEGYLMYARKDQVHFDYSKQKRSCKDFKYSANGTFFNRNTNKLVSIVVNDGEVYHDEGSKVGRGKAEGTIYMTNDGEIYWNRLFNINQVEDVKWGISGCSLHNFHPDWEGFYGDASDIFRYTWHTVFGVTQNDNIVLFTKFCHGHKLVDDVQNRLNLKFAILLDGGSMGACASPKFSVNGYTRQNNIVYFSD